MRPSRTSVVLIVAAVTAAVVTGSGTLASAYHCPALVKECHATADIVAKRDGTDKDALAKARKGCDEAMKLHGEGQHKESMVKVGEAIADVSRALK